MGRLPFIDLQTSRSRRFDALIRPHVLALYQFAFRLMRNRADAEDLVQDVLTKLYGRVDEMAEVRELKPWLLRVTYRQFVDELRKRRRSAHTVSDMNHIESIEDSLWAPDHQFAVAETGRRLRDALARLSRDQQLLVGLHLVDGHTLEELAGSLDVPLGTLKSRLHRTRAQLRNMLTMEPFSDDPREGGHELQ